ncbi:MAG: DUF87 domain-containing protein [Candidatus Woesearchaeota archaeon]
MAYEVVIGRNPSDRKKFGLKGTIFLGKQYIKMGQTTSLSNDVFMDVTRSHVVFVCGKRGSGKSYSMGVMAEGMSDLPSEIKENLAVVMLDTMGIYWTMKYPNHKEDDILQEWGLEGKPLDVHIYTPTGFYKTYKDKGIPTDFPFSIEPGELNADDWCITFEVDQLSPLGVYIEKIIKVMKQKKKKFSIQDILKVIRDDKDASKESKDGAINRFEVADSWGLFSENGTPLKDIVKGGQVTVIDVSCYVTAAGGSGVRALVIGLISKKLFLQRMIARTGEEYDAVSESVHYFAMEEKTKKEMPLVWLIIDEAHEFLPLEGKTSASDALITILREGRQPGISLILASQQPGKIHTDVMTQSDIVLSHRLTAKVDVDALGMLMQSYMREGLDKAINNLPPQKGSAIVFDDINERMYPMKVRPRFTWHGGEAPNALKEKKELFDL